MPRRQIEGRNFGTGRQQSIKTAVVGACLGEDIDVAFAPETSASASMNALASVYPLTTPPCHVIPTSELTPCSSVIEGSLGMGIG